MHLEGPPDAADEAPFKWVARRAQVVLTTFTNFTTCTPFTTSPPHHLTTPPPHHLTTSPPHHAPTVSSHSRMDGPGAGCGALRRALHQC